jgi:hypothetical protein
VESYFAILRVVHLDVADALVEKPLEVLLGADALLAVAGHAGEATDVLDDAACAHNGDTASLSAHRAMSTR